MATDTPSQEFSEKLIQAIDTAGNSVLETFKITGNPADVTQILFEEKELEALYSLGFGYYQQGNYVEAGRLFEVLCRFQNLESRNFKALGASYRMQGLHKSAIDAYGMAAILDLDDPEPSLYAAESLISMKYFAEAKSALEAAIQQAEEMGDTTIQQHAEKLLQSLPEGTSSKNSAPLKNGLDVVLQDIFMSLENKKSD